MCDHAAPCVFCWAVRLLIPLTRSTYPAFIFSNDLPRARSQVSLVLRPRPALLHRFISFDLMNRIDRPAADADPGMGVLLLPHVLHDRRRGDQGFRPFRHPRRYAFHGSARHQEAVQGAFAYLSPRQGESLLSQITIRGVRHDSSSSEARMADSVPFESDHYSRRETRVIEAQTLERRT